MREPASPKLATLRVLLVDDDQDFLTIASHDLKRLTRIEIVATALSGDEAVRLVPVLQPDLVLMDIDMPGMNGVHATRQIKAQPNAPKVVSHSYLDRSTAQDMVLITGADSYVSKSDLVSQLDAELDRLFGAEPRTPTAVGQ